MRRSLKSRAAWVVVALALAAPAAAQSFAWWKDQRFQKEVGLSSDQCSRIDAVFQTALPQLKQGKGELDRLEGDLSRLIDSNADEAQVVRQVDRVEAQRAALNKARTLMLLHMRQLMTPDQLVRFKAAHDQWEKEHPRPPRSGGPTKQQ